VNTIITEVTENGDEYAIDIFHKLANNRMFFIYESIDEKIATDLIAALILKDSENSEEKITLIINSGGGDIRSVFMMYDMMQMISSPIETICVGQTSFESVVILCAGTPGMRFATKNSIFCISQLIHDRMSYSDLTDAKYVLSQIKKDNKRQMEILAKHTSHTLSQVMKDFEKKKFLTAQEALKYGFVDKIVSHKR
jgi:ATP-dependent Clp protease protease subunit